MAKNIHQRIADAMQEVTYIQKERKQGMRYTIVSHDAVTAKVRPALLKSGVVYYPIRCETGQSGNRTEARMTIRFVNIDEPTDLIDVETFGYGIDDQDKGPGKAMSYAVKYALLKTLGLETGDDPDLDQDVRYMSPASNAKISAAQVSQLQEMIESAEADLRAFCQYAKVASLADITESNFASAKAALEAKMKKKG